MAKHYGVPVVLHTDHCSKKLLPWVDGLMEANEVGRGGVGKGGGEDVEANGVHRVHGVHGLTGCMGRSRACRLAASICVCEFSL